MENLSINLNLNKMVEYFNPNPTCKFFKSGKPKNWYVDDSAIRVVSKVFDIDWTNAYDKLAECGKIIFDVPTSKSSIDHYLTENGFEFVTLGKPKKGSRRPNVEEFIKDIDTNKVYVLNLADYFVTVKDGKVYDVSDECLKSSVYSYWVK